MTLPFTGSAIKLSCQLEAVCPVVSFPSPLSKYAWKRGAFLSLIPVQVGVIPERLDRRQRYGLLITLRALPYCDNATKGCCEAECTILSDNHCHLTKEIKP